MAVASPVTNTTTFVVSDPVAGLRERFGDKITDVAEFRGETTITIAREVLPDVAKALRDDFGFDQCVDVTALDWYVQAHAAPNPDGLLADGQDLADIELPTPFQHSGIRSLEFT